MAVKYNNDVDYMALMQQTTDPAKLAEYEAARNQKIADMNAAGTNTQGYQQSFTHTSPTGGNVTAAQTYAQAASPATAATGQTSISQYTKPGSGSGVSSSGDFNDYQSIVDQMNQNSIAWHGASSGEQQAQLAQQNQQYGDQLRQAGYDATYDAASGTWQLTGMGAKKTTGGLPTYQEANTGDYWGDFNSYNDQLGNLTYNPVDQEKYTGKVMGWEDAYNYAMQVLSPQYNAAASSAATAAAQNLERAGLSDSLYGQSLLAGTRQSAENELASQAWQLANEIVGMDRDYALNLLNLAQNDNQFGASYKQSNISQAATNTLAAIDTLLTEARDKNNFALESYALQLQAEAQAVEAAYVAGQISQMELENELMRLEMQAMNNSYSGGGYADNAPIVGNGGGLYDDNGINDWSGNDVVGDTGGVQAYLPGVGVMSQTQLISYFRDRYSALAKDAVNNLKDYGLEATGLDTRPNAKDAYYSTPEDISKAMANAQRIIWAGISADIDSISNMSEAQKAAIKRAVSGSVQW